MNNTASNLKLSEAFLYTVVRFSKIPNRIMNNITIYSFIY